MTWEGGVGWLVQAKPSCAALSCSDVAAMRCCVVTNQFVEAVVGTAAEMHLEVPKKPQAQHRLVRLEHAAGEKAVLMARGDVSYTDDAGATGTSKGATTLT